MKPPSASGRRPVGKTVGKVSGKAAGKAGRSGTGSGLGSEQAELLKTDARKTAPGQTGSGKAGSDTKARPGTALTAVPADAVPFGMAVPLELARAQWREADWGALVRLGKTPLEAEPDRAQLALLAAAGLAQCGETEAARRMIRQARDWGCASGLIARVLLSGVLNSLGCLAILYDATAARARFESALRLLVPEREVEGLAARRDIQERNRLGMKATAPKEASVPTLVVVAGMPRSGSTWLFNAVRLLLQATGRPVEAAWFAEYDRNAKAPLHLVKLHDPIEAVGLDPALVLTTWRDFDACIASLVRMGWTKDDVDARRRARQRQETVYQYWAARSDLEIDFDEIVNDPERAVLRLAAVLGVAAEAAPGVLAGLAALVPPETGSYDRTTLLHPGHLGPGHGR